MGGNPDARVNADWDSWFLQQLGTADLDAGRRARHDGLEELAGSGGHEIRSWLIGHAAVRAPLRWTSYEAGPGVDHRHGDRHHASRWPERWQRP